MLAGQICLGTFAGPVAEGNGASVNIAGESPAPPYPITEPDPEVRFRVRGIGLSLVA